MAIKLPILVLALLLALACAPSPAQAQIPAAPVLTLWPDPTFLPERQCHGNYRVEELKRFLPQARLALWLPGTQAVTLDEQRRCLIVRVDGIGSGRLAALVLRGMEVPRRAVLLLWS